MPEGHGHSTRSRGERSALILESEAKDNTLKKYKTARAKLAGVIAAHCARLEVDFENEAA